MARRAFEARRAQETTRYSAIGGACREETNSQSRAAPLANNAVRARAPSRVDP